MRVVSLLWAALFLAACLSGTALAENGNVILSPRLDVGLEWGDNLQREPGDTDTGHGAAQNGWIYRVDPSISAQVPVGERTFFELDYKLGFVYIDSRDLTPVKRNAQGVATHGGDDTYDTTTHDLRALARYSLSDTMSVGVSDRYRYSEVVEADGDAYELNTASASFKKQFAGSFLGELSYSYQTFHDPDRDREYANYDQETVEGSGTYRLSPWTSVKLDLGYALRDFDGDEWSERDYNRTYTMAMLTHRLNETLTATAKVGYHWQSFTSDIDADGEDYGVGLQSTVGDMTTLALMAEHSTEDIFYVPERSVTPVIGFSKAQVSATSLDRDYVAIETDRVTLTANLAFTAADTLKLGGGWVHADADTEYDTAHLDESATTVPDDLDEDSWFAGVGIAHKFPQWAKLSVDYTYGERDSNLEGRDYHYNSVAAKVSFVF